MKALLLLLTIVGSGITVKAIEKSTCEDGPHYHLQGLHSIWQIVYTRNDYWLNTTFWGGYNQIPQKEDVDRRCFVSGVSGLIVLLDKHPDVTTLDENVVSTKACSIDRDGNCQFNLQIFVRRCGEELRYGFENPYDIGVEEIWHHYICFSRIYSTTCSDTSTVQLAGEVDGNVFHFDQNTLTDGWINGFVDGRQYFPPGVGDIDIVAERCLYYNSQWIYGYFLQETNWHQVIEVPVRIFTKYVWASGDETYIQEGNSGKYVYVRRCNGQLHFDMEAYTVYSLAECLIHHNNISVHPEIRHFEAYSNKDGFEGTEYIPHLQFRCFFDMAEDTSYYINWYINGTLREQKGPSSVSDELVFNEDYINDIPLGYEIECGVIVSTENMSTEALSDVFYAGWKIPDESITVRKSGYTIVELEQTIPVGCRYSDDYESSMCTTELNFIDQNINSDICAGKIGINGVDGKKKYIEIKSLKKGDTWTENKKHQVKLYTIDNDYDDETSFDLDISSTRGDLHNQDSSISEILGSVHVVVTDFDIHKNKRCYSHVDPHHKTSDGERFEMQREGDHMMYLNEAYQTEIQQSARYCYRGRTTGPICACGIAIRVGADAFVINRCPDRDFKFDFIQSGDGGIIDLERVNDYRYLVRTPIGTIVDISLHTWSSTMNIDIYMSAKDVGNVVGLCGQFDGDRSNDFLHRDRQTFSNDNNRSYKFSDSWKLTDEENLFKNEQRVLVQWNSGGQTCSRPNSITKKKYAVPKRKKRSLSNRPMDQQIEFPFIRAKRSEVNFTEEEAFRLCNKSIYETPAVMEFADKLAEEDPDEVVTQCVYDIITGKDTAWVDAHTSVLNNAADTILKLNPVYVANHTEIVEGFLSKTCLNNCSQNGVCTKQGVCECDGKYHGPDCGIDITVPPVVYEVHGGDICHTGDGNDCSCFQLRTDNIFEGFMCEMSTYKVYFNGTRVKEDHKTSLGDYVDIFTGTCCSGADRKKRSNSVEDTLITLYIFNISNDGTNYGEPNAVFVYDTTCIQQSEIDGEYQFSIKDQYCFIDDTCVLQNEGFVATDECDLCDPNVNQFKWTKGHCENSDGDEGLKTAAVVGIAVGSLSALLLTVILVYWLCIKKSKSKRSIQDSRTDLGKVISMQPPPVLGRSADVKPQAVSETKEQVDDDTHWLSFLPDITTADVAKPVCNRSMLKQTQHYPDIESSNTGKDQLTESVADNGIQDVTTDATVNPETASYECFTDDYGDRVSTANLEDFENNLVGVNACIISVKSFDVGN